jgi:hypothetical protein
MIASGRELGMPIMARKIAEGRWVKTIVLTFPNRLAMEDATKIDAAEIRLVVKNKEPNFPSARWKRLRK